jgi:hypothetical protein
MHTSFVLTVAQSKRLIARAVTRMPEVTRALQEGTVAIARGTTNAYVVEEILGKAIPKGEYASGRTLPPGMPGEWLGRGDYPEVVLRQGKLVAGLTAVEAVKEMGPGDVFMKGGNALDYQRKLVGVLIGHPTGGTIGAAYGTIVSRKINLVIPIGLEKLVCGDLVALSLASRRPEDHPGAGAVALFPMVGTIVTEIEALGLLCGVSARLLGAGGVAGAEGAVWLLVEGDRPSLDRALELHRSLGGEPGLSADRRPADRAEAT